MTQDSIDAAGFREACRHAGRLAEALGLGDYGHSIGEIVDTAIDRLAARADATQQAGLTLSRAEAVDLHWLLAVAIHSGLPRGDMLNLAHGLSRRVADYTGGDTSTTDAWRRRTSAPAREADPQPVVADDVREAGETDD